MLTNDRLAEIRERHMDGDYATDAVVHGHVADLLAEVDLLTRQLAECHELLKAAERGDTIRPGSVTLLLHRHRRPT